MTLQHSFVCVWNSVKYYTWSAPFGFPYMQENSLSLIVSDLPANCRAHLQRLTDSKTLFFVIRWTVYSVNDVFFKNYLSDCVIQPSSCHITINWLIGAFSCVYQSCSLVPRFPTMHFWPSRVFSPPLKLSTKQVVVGKNIDINGIMANNQSFGNNVITVHTRAKYPCKI